ncbi:hypothetical protein EUTSA_v10009925mg [Eutrema salsugineum]|uniref:Uncharacterized protein n=1 Tax=Eutrema salsugineum TaxID=72664 RepID=V4MSG8_EUTSA|nr:hypothetical protein EUTSA_v10009925mg [Eutrema salsugineum]
MGLVVFKWGYNKLTLLQNREQQPAAWDDDNQILRGVPEDNFGTWCGISKRGRVAFVVNSSCSLSPSMHRPIDFLRGEMSPMEFARAWSSDNDHRLDRISSGLNCFMIVADINANSMVYASKTSPRVLEVAFGVHTLASVTGLDSDGDYYLVKRQKELFSEMISKYKKRKVPPLKDMAENFMYKGDRSAPHNSSNETLSTIALAVKPNEDVNFYQRYLKNGTWKDHSFTFKITA